MVKVEFDVGYRDAMDLIKFAELIEWANERNTPGARKMVEKIENMLDGKEA